MFKKTMFALMALMASTTALLADTLHVPQDHATIEAAVAAAQDGDIVLVSPGVHEVNVENGVWIEKDLTIKSTEGLESTIIRTNTGMSLQIHEVGSVHISGFTFEQGERAPVEQGQAISINRGKDVKIDHCLFEGLRHRDNGGAIDSFRSNVRISNCSFIRNRVAGVGGAIQVKGFYEGVESPGCRIEDCVFIDNSAEIRGGAIFASLFAFGEYEPAELIVNRCAFKGNRTYEVGVATTHRGGAIFVQSTGTPDVSIEITNNLFHGQHSGSGAAMYFGSMSSDPQATTPVLLSGNTIVGNTARDEGSAIFVDNNILSVPNPGSLPTFKVDVHNSIFWGNEVTEGDEGSQIVLGDESEGLVEYSIVQGGFPGMGNLDQKPLFVDARRGDFRLLAWSPGVDAANGDKSSGVDLIGLPWVDLVSIRNTGTGNPDYVDMGCYETQR